MVINGVTESSPCIFLGLPYLLSIHPLSLSIKLPAMWSFIRSALSKEPSHFPSEALQLKCPLQRMSPCPNTFKRAFVLTSRDKGLLDAGQKDLQALIQLGPSPVRPTVLLERSHNWYPREFLIKCTGTEPSKVNRIFVLCGRNS